MDFHISDGQHVLKKPVLFTEVGSLMHRKKQGLHYTDTFLKIVYNEIYNSAKKRQAGAGALIWQLLVEGVEEYGDQFSIVAWDYPSIYEMMVEQSCRLRSVFAEDQIKRELQHGDLCFGKVFNGSD